MKTEDIKKMAQAWNEVQEAKKKKLDPVGKADADIDNDGDVDSSDKYLHNRRKTIKKSMKKDTETQIDEISKEKAADYKKKSVEYSKDALRSNDPKKLKKVGNRIAGAGRATKILNKESVDLDEANAPKATHTPNNGSDPDQGLSPSAKKEKERKTPISPEVDEPKVDAMNFKTFRNMTKASPKRSNDQTIGDKTMPKNDGK